MNGEYYQSVEPGMFCSYMQIILYRTMPVYTRHSYFVKFVIIIYGCQYKVINNSG